MGWHIPSVESENCQPRIPYLAKLSFKNAGEIKTFPGKQNPRKSVASRPALQEISKGIFQTEMGGY